jgi:hypothetical protein
MSEGQWRGPDYGLDYELDGTGYPTRVFVRRCGWCGVRLRRWQVNLCQLCGPAVRSSDFRTSPCVEGSRWAAPMDRWPWGRAATSRVVE